MHLERSLDEELPGSLSQWKPDGVLTRLESQAMAEVVARLNVPAVDLRGTFRPAGGGLIDTDPRICAQLAVDHFLERGFRHFAFCGYPGVDFSDQRLIHFTQTLEKRGPAVDLFANAEPQLALRGTTAHETQGEIDETRIAEWLSQLPRPAAVLACNDVRGRQVIYACKLAGLSVPEDVAVLGVDDDEVICELSTPPLSSIEPDTKRIGFEGAALLDRMMLGEPAPEGAILIPPRGISVRLSSDVLAVDDRDVSRALRYIRDHACDGISVRAVAKAAAMSRTTLDRRFQQLLGRSPKAEIDRVRLERAKRLLRDTDYKLERVAALCGFATAAQFVSAFRRMTQVTPGAYRRQIGVA